MRENAYTAPHTHASKLPKTDWSGERGSKNQVERERSGSGRSSEREQSAERAKSAAQNPLYRKTVYSK